MAIVVAMPLLKGKCKASCELDHKYEKSLRLYHGTNQLEQASKYFLQVISPPYDLVQYQLMLLF